MSAAVRVDRVSVQFEGHQALHEVCLEIEAGEFIVLLGPSGCGKTTLLSVLGGFVAPTTGRVEIGGQDMTHVPPQQRPTTTMFQDYALFPHMSLLDNVGFGLRMRGVDRKKRDARALELLDLVGLAAAAKRRPNELSGGQRQRVALARALAVDPVVLLLDEPLGALDLKLRRQMQDELKAIQRRVGTTFVHVTHDQEEAMAIADRIVVMNAGRIEDLGTPAQVYLQPRSRFSAAFMGEVNLLDLSQDANNRWTSALGLIPEPVAQAVAEETKDIGAAGTEATRPALAIRPESLRVSQVLSPSQDTEPLRRLQSIRTLDPDVAAGTPSPAVATASPGSNAAIEMFSEGGALGLGSFTVVDLAFMGTHQRLHVRSQTAPHLEWVVHVPVTQALAVGESVSLEADHPVLVMESSK